MRLRFSSVLLISFLITANSYLVSQQGDNYVEAHGIIENYIGEPLAGAQLTLFEAGSPVKNIRTTSNGEYSFFLEYNKEYIIEISKPGLVTKKLYYNTQMPENKRGGWALGIPINLFKVCEGMDTKVYEEPVVKVYFDSEANEYAANVDWDRSRTPKIRNFEQANANCLDNQFEQLLDKADNLLKQDQLDTALDIYLEASEERPWDEYLTYQIDKVNKKIEKRGDLRTGYNKLISQADQFMDNKNYTEARKAYSKASKILPNEMYPQNKINEIERIEMQIALQNEQQQQADEKYNSFIRSGDAAFNSKEYAQASSLYNQALEAKPNDGYAQNKINIINNLQRQNAQQQLLTQQKDTEYNQAISQADQLFAQNKFEEAKMAYQQASSIKPDETYPKTKLTQIDSKLAAIEREQALQLQRDNLKKQQFDLFASTGERYLQQGNYNAALEAYQKAQSIENRPDIQNKILLIQNKISEEEQAKLQQLAEQKRITDEFNNQILKGDALIKNKQYQEALTAYQEAKKINPSSQTVNDKIKIANDMLQSSIAEQKLAQQQLVDQSYSRAITEGDNYLAQNQFDMATSAYQKAAQIKPDESLPQLKINQAKAKEQEQLEAAKRQNEIDRLNMQYNSKVSLADEQFQQNNYQQAIELYREAITLKPQEQYPKTQILAANQNLLEIQKANRAQEQRDALYNNAIKQGDTYLAQNNPENAALSYKEALKIKPEDPLATNKLSQVTNQIEAQKKRDLAQKQQEEQFQTLLTHADNEFSNNNYNSALSSYQNALRIKNDDPYTRERIEEINGILERQRAKELAQAQLNKQYSALITQADKLYDAKDYVTAKTVYEDALNLKPDESHPQTRVKNIDNLLERISASQQTTTKTVVKPTTVQPVDLPELEFSNENARKSYLSKLLKEFPDGITHEVYKGKKSTTDRYIIIRNNDAHEFRAVRYSWGYTEYSRDGKPINQQYFDQQVRKRDNEYYKKVEK